MSSIKGYIDYQRREFCKDIKCPVQLDLDKQEPGSKTYVKPLAGVPLMNSIIG